MTMGPAWTLEALTVLSLFKSGAKHHCHAIHQQTGLAVGTVHGILRRFEGGGILASTMETVDPRLSSRVPRIFYKITDDGRHTMRTLRDLLST